MADKKKKATRRPVVPVVKTKSDTPVAKATRGGLGKGLDALISRGEHAIGIGGKDAAAANANITVPLAKIKPSPWQPRHEFDEKALAELADSIRVHGVIQPLICRNTTGGAYELIGGERRLRAANAAGLLEVPVILMDVADRDAAELALVENLQREDLNVVEEAEAYKSLSDNFDMTQEEIAERVGRARASVANALRLLELPDEVKQMLGSGVISTGHAKLILGIDGDEVRVNLAGEVVKNGLTVRALEQRIAQLKAEPREARKAPKPDIPPEYQAMLLDKLIRRFGTGARLTPSMTHQNGRRVRGRVEIDFVSNSDLSRLLDLFGIDVNE